MFGTEVPAEFLTVLLGVTLTGLMTYFAWMTREMTKLGSVVSGLQADGEDRERRLARAEGQINELQQLRIKQLETERDEARAGRRQRPPARQSKE